jgi:AraC-like DNA-binding protein
VCFRILRQLERDAAPHASDLFGKQETHCRLDSPPGQHGLSWREAVGRVRLETAIDLMEEPTCSLADIADTLGYTQYAHFYRAFQRWTGESPRKYREKFAL